MFPNRKNFTPEIKPKLIKYDKDLWNKIFPKENNQSYQLSNIGKYSIIYPKYAEEIAFIIKSYFNKKDITITDATANIGGMSMIFSKYFKLNAIEIIPFHCEILKNNLKNYPNKYEYLIYCKDYLDIMMDLEQDVVFMDPPFGGVNYKEEKNLDLYLDNVNIVDIIIKLMENKKTKIIAIRLPINFRFNKLLKYFSKTNTYTFYKDNKPYFFLTILKLNYFIK